MIEGIPLPKLVEHLAQQVIIADAEMQLLQRKGWMEMNREAPSLEGMDHLAHLGLQELRVTFGVEPVPPGLWARIKRSYRCLLGRRPVAESYPLALGAHGAKGFTVTITVGREGNRFVATAAPEVSDQGEVYVSDLSA